MGMWLEVGVGSIMLLLSSPLLWTRPSGLVDSDKMHAATITFSKSLAGYSVATFILVSEN